MVYRYEGCVALSNYITCLVGQKVSSLPTGSRRSVDAGRLTTYLTTDTKNIQGAAMTVHQIIVTPILLLVYTGMIIGVTKWVGFIIVGIFLIITPLQIMLSNFVLKQTKIRLSLVDQRSRIMTSIILHMKNIKLLGFEKIAIERVDHFRKQEKKYAFKATATRALVEVIGRLIPSLTAISIIWIYNKAYTPRLTAANTYYIISIMILGGTATQSDAFGFSGYVVG